MVLVELLKWVRIFELIPFDRLSGWNSWNHFDCGINEDLIRQTADAIVKTGLKDFGYTYVNMVNYIRT